MTELVRYVGNSDSASGERPESNEPVNSTTAREIPLKRKYQVEKAPDARTRAREWAMRNERNGHLPSK